MDLSQLRVCKRPNGDDWVLGQGTFGTVRVPGFVHPYEADCSALLCRNKCSRSRALRVS